MQRKQLAALIALDSFLDLLGGISFTYIHVMKLEILIFSLFRCNLIEFGLKKILFIEILGVQEICLLNLDSGNFYHATRITLCRIDIPYPFQWGVPTFNFGDALTMMFASFVASVEVCSLILYLSLCY